MYQFDGQLKKGINRQGWTYIDVPAEISIKFKKTGRIPVSGSVDNVKFRTSVLPKGDGTFYFFVSIPLRQSIGKKAGDYVTVLIEEDTKPRIVNVPKDIFEALSTSDLALATFNKFSYSHKKELIEWINEAKRTETRQRRIAKAVVILESYKKRR